MLNRTDKPLPRFLMHGSTRSLEWITISVDSRPDYFDLDQPYQRGHVWGLERKTNLIKSFFIGVPVPGIVINNRFDAKFTHPGYEQRRNWAFSVIDGKQRVQTVLDFTSDQFPIPSWWLEPDLIDDPNPGKMVFHSDLSNKGRLTFGGSIIPVSVGNLKTLEQEEIVFKLINEGGVPQGESDLDQIAGPSPQDG